MITVNRETFHKSLKIEEAEIILNGTPGFLSGNIYLKNHHDDTVFIREVPMVAADSAKSKQKENLPSHFKLLTSLRSGEERVQQITLQLPATTPPGRYERKMMIGGQEKKLTIIVQPNVEIDINPLMLHFQGIKSGNKYDAEISLTNAGNMPFKIPSNIKHSSMLDEDYFCRAMSLAIRKKGGEGYTATMDELTKNIYSEMTDWVGVNIKESGKVVQPGQSMQLHFSLTMPAKVDRSRDYFGNVRLWNKEISYRINAFDDAVPVK